MQRRENSLSIVHQTDYEKYIIPVSIDSLFGKKRSIYLFKELEKRHPCFNSDFCVDSVLKVVNKKLVFDVVVMNKLKYMKYKSRKNTTFLGFRFDSSLFSYRFANKTLIRRMILIILICVFLFCYLCSKIINKKTKVVEDNLSISTSVEEPIKEKLYLQYKSVLEKVKEKHGEISLFSWKIDGYFEEFTCLVENIYPEDLGNIIEESSIVVEYNNGKPSFTVSLKKNVSINKCINNSITQDYFVVSEIRKIVKNGKMEIIEEQTNPMKISFICKNDFSLLEKIGVLLKDKNIAVNGIVIKRNANKEINVELKIEKDISYVDGLLLNDFREYESIFFIKEKNPVVSIKKEKIIFTEQNLKEKRKKVGEISYEDGRKIVFYKNEKGQIVKELEK